jgi:hypothetical protein
MGLGFPAGPVLDGRNPQTRLAPIGLFG